MEKEEIKKDPLFNLLEIIKVRKIPIIIGFLSVLAITIVGTFLMPTYYEVSTKIYVNVPLVPKDLPYLEDLMDKAFVANQVVVASSRPIYEKAVLQLNLHKREESTSFLSKIKNIFFKKSSDPLEEAINDLYRITDVKLIRGTNIITIAARSNSPEGAAAIANTLANTYTAFANGLMFSRAQMAYDSVAEKFETVRKELNTSQSFLSGLKGSVNVIEDRISNVRRLAEYKTQYEQIEERIHRIQYERAQAEKNKVETPAIPYPPVPQKSPEPKKVKSEEVYPVQSVESPKVKELRERLTKVKNELDMALGRYTEKHPNVKRLKNQVANLEEELTKEENISLANQSSQPVPSKPALPEVTPQPEITPKPELPVRPVISAYEDLNYLEVKKEDLSRQIKILEGKLLKLSLIESESEKLSRNVSGKEVQYAFLKEKLETARILKEQTQEGTIKVIEVASPPPFSSNKKKIISLVVGFIASLVFGLGAGFVAEYLDESFKSQEEVEQSLKFPVLAAIPHISKKMRKEGYK